MGILWNKSLIVNIWKSNHLWELLFLKQFIIAGFRIIRRFNFLNFSCFQTLNHWFESNTHPRSIVLWQVLISYAADSCKQRQKQRTKQASEYILEFDFWISRENQLCNLLFTKEKINSEGYFQKYFDI